MSKLEEVKENAHHFKEHDFFTTLHYEDYLWLIEQAEIASGHGELVMENADLINFKKSAESILNERVLREIQEEMNDVPETGY